MRHRENGDTIIEVLFAITVFSLIAVGGLSIMNQGTALAQRALEINLVRQQMDTQADVLRYLNQSYVADFGKDGFATQRWNKILNDRAVASAQSFDQVADPQGCNIPTRSFALDPTKLNDDPVLTQPDGLLSNPSTYAQLRYDSLSRSEGIWVQAVEGNVANGRPGYHDFHIRACWFSPGQSVPMTLGTIVRLYEPPYVR